MCVCVCVCVCDKTKHQRSCLLIVSLEVITQNNVLVRSCHDIILVRLTSKSGVSNKLYLDINACRCLNVRLKVGTKTTWGGGQIYC